MPSPLSYLGAAQASTSGPGIVELATIAETVAGTRTDVATTPAGVAAVAIAGAPDASSTQKGIIEIATNSEAAAASSGTLALVPSNLPSVFAAAPAIGGTTPAAGAFTTLSASGAFSLSGDQVQVAEGGTGAASLTDHGVLLGSGTAAVSVTAVGTNNQVFIGQTAADPIWSSNLDLPGTLDVTGVTTLDDALSVAGASTLTGAVTHSDTTSLEGNITISDGINVILDTTTGTKIGTATTQKIGFLNATPVAQQANTTDIKDVLVNFGFLANGGATPLNLDGGAISSGTITLADATNIVVDTTTGTKIGTATTQKLGFFNATPVVQPANTSDIKDALTDLGLLATGGATPLNLDGGDLTCDDITCDDIGCGSITITDGDNIILDSTTGSKIGTATTQKLAFYNSTPIVQPANTTDLKDAIVNLGLLASGGVTPLNLDGGDLTCDQIISNDLTVATVTIATGDVLQLATTPYQLIAAPGAGKFLEFVSAQLILDYNSVPYTESGDNMAIRYTNGSGVIVSQAIESTGFIDQAADTITNALPKIDAIVAASGAVNQALVLDNTGADFAAGNSPLIVKIAYRIHTSGL